MLCSVKWWYIQVVDKGDLFTYLCWQSTSSPGSSPLIPCLQLQLSCSPFFLFFPPLPPFSPSFLSPLALFFSSSPSLVLSLLLSSSSPCTCLSLFQWQQQRSPLRRWHGFQQFGRRSHYHSLVKRGEGRRRRRGGGWTGWWREIEVSRCQRRRKGRNKTNLRILAVGSCTCALS